MAKDLPAAELGRFITFSEISRTCDTPVDTIVAWHRLIRAMGYEFGRKIRGVWNFSPHEFYQFNVAGALSLAGYPVGLEILRQMMESTQQPGRPDKTIFFKTPGTFAIIAVDAPGLWDAAASMIRRAEAYAHA